MIQAIEEPRTRAVISHEIEAVRAERQRILGFRSLSTADWQRVRELDAELVELGAEKRAAPGPLLDPERTAFARQLFANGRAR